MKRYTCSGFTLVELIIVISLFSIIFAFIFINFARPKVFADIKSSEDLVFVTIKEAQNLSMSGATGGTGAGHFGVHFEQDKFVLFEGSTYNPADSSNLVTLLSPNLSIESITLQSGNIIFSRLSGEVSGINPGQDSFVLRETNSGETRTFTTNRFGVVDVN